MFAPKFSPIKLLQQALNRAACGSTPQVSPRHSKPPRFLALFGFKDRPFKRLSCGRPIKPLKGGRKGDPDEIRSDKISPGTSFLMATSGGIKVASKGRSKGSRRGLISKGVR